MSVDGPSIKQAPPPWTCRCEAYWMMFYGGDTLPDDVYAPLEAQSVSFSDPAKGGRFRGGLGMIQIVRYSDTPVGSYDELLLIPGFFDLPGSTNKHCRITRIYVNQKDTCYNGRKNWGIPKHLARFSFSYPPSGPTTRTARSLKVEVFPPDASATTPFLVVRLEPIRWVPSIPFSTKTAPYLGLDIHLAQPPLPASEKAGEEELTGSDGWLKALPYLYSPKARLMWIDVQQPAGRRDPSSHEDVDGSFHNVEDAQKWWPAIKPWNVGLWLEDATIVLESPEKLL